MQPKTVLISGCSSGIGRATAKGFLDENWTVYATARNPADIQVLGDEGAHVATLDVTDDDDVEHIVDRIVDEQNRIDCLVNNAGYGQMGPLEDVPTDQVHRQFDVNVYGPHRLTRAVLPQMREQEGGTIVNVSSVAGRVSFPGGGVYCGSKFALEAMTDALRGEVAEYGVDAVLVEPGPVSTEFGKRVEKEVTDGGDVPGVERSGAYESFYRLMVDAQATGGDRPGSVPPGRVADEIVNAASATDPDPRYPVGVVAKAGNLARLVPDTWRDVGYRLVTKLVR